ncbi:unnamed protein product [Somion occarium]|uniref:Uncharacterized protein n=1 Tax=Somion occarium TaxID=3059160 RepID=A0ABP1DJA4_9APHY
MNEGFSGRAFRLLSSASSSVERDQRVVTAGILTDTETHMKFLFVTVFCTCTELSVSRFLPSLSSTLDIQDQRHYSTMWFLGQYSPALLSGGTQNKRDWPSDA